MAEAFDPAMTGLGLATLFWIILHLALAGSPLRWAVVRVIGDNGFRGLFSLLSAIGLGWLIWAYAQATTPESFYGLRIVETWMMWVPPIVMAPALILFVGSLTVPNPTMVQGERLLAGEPAKGILRVTRHPMLWSFALWSASHLVANGDLASLLLFGGLLVVSLAGMGSIDRKQLHRDPANYRRFMDATSILPFAAIAAGRNRFDFSEIGWGRIALAAGLWIVLVALHPLAFGVPAVP